MASFSSGYIFSTAHHLWEQHGWLAASTFKDYGLYSRAFEPFSDCGPVRSVSKVAILLFLCREALVQMDVPTRQSQPGPNLASEFENVNVPGFLLALILRVPMRQILVDARCPKTALPIEF
jgi:hypothetical protein